MLLSILVLAKSKVNAFVEVSTGCHLENNCDVNLAVLEPLFSLSGAFYVCLHPQVPLRNRNWCTS